MAEERKAPDRFDDSITPHLKTGCGNIYCTFDYYKGHSEKRDKVKRIHAHLGKAGGCPSAMLDGMSYLAKVALKYGAPKSEVVKGLKGIICPEATDVSKSCPDAIGRMIDLYYNDLEKQEAK